MYTLSSSVSKPSNINDVILPHEEIQGITLRCLKQVQDVGLIFLSAMTTAIAQLCAQQGLDARVALGSSLLTITLSTFLTGLLVKLTGGFLPTRNILPASAGLCT